MENNIEELGNSKDLQSYLVNSRKIQEDIPYLKEIWSEITNSESERRLRKYKEGINLNVTRLSEKDAELEERFIENKYAVLELAIKN